MPLTNNKKIRSQDDHHQDKDKDAKPNDDTTDAPTSIARVACTPSDPNQNQHTSEDQPQKEPSHAAAERHEKAITEEGQTHEKQPQRKQNATTYTTASKRSKTLEP